MSAAREQEKRRLESVRELTPTGEPGHSVTTLPAGSGMALIGAALMVIGAFGPWIGGRFFSATSGIDLGGDGWLVLAAAMLALGPVVLPVAGPAARGGWVAGLALLAGYVCWTHYTQAHSDGAEVVWGLELAGVGCGLLALSGLRLLTGRS
jgi:hypothetical protein